MMFEYSVMSTLLVLLLLKQNWCAQKRLKSQKHDYVNLIKKHEVHKELLEKNQILKTENYNLNIKFQQQQKINFILLEKFNNIIDNAIDIPNKNNRFFAMSVNRKTIIALFSEN
jgi:hypothetical protein